MTPPPDSPDSGADRRRAPRYDIYAQANVVSSDETYVMAVRNVSASGAFLEGDPREHPDLRPGSGVEVVLSIAEAGASDDDVLNIRCTGKVVRIDPGAPPARPGGFGLELQPVGGEDQQRFEQVLRGLAGGA